MGLYPFLTNAYAQFLSIFPPQWQWFITLLILIGLVGALVGLISRNPLFALLLLILLPVLIPVLHQFGTDLYHFALFLIQALSASAPKP